MSLSQIVVGIDFGTTHSGVSWAIKISGGEPTIRVINDWPNPRAQNATSDKVPTSISYLNGAPNNWGYQNVPSEETFKWFKILLEPNHKYKHGVDSIKQSTKLLEVVNKTPEQVAGDYLGLLWAYTKEDICRCHGNDWEEIYSLSVVLTVPAIWSAVAKDRTLSAAKAAGLPHNILLVTEPEAAALAVLQAKAIDAELQVGDSFVVCDAGGGTVDLISYTVKGLSPLQIQESAVGDGDLCGSVYLDMAFEKYIITIVGEEQYRKIKTKSKAKMKEDFEYNVKRTFTGMDGMYCVDLKGVEDDEDLDIDDDTIKLKVSMLKTIFDHVCNQIQSLVEKQIDSVEDKGGNVKAVLLVGGFGSSKYLHSHLAAYQKSSGIRVLQSKNAWSAICRGATGWGLEHAEVLATTPSRTNKTVVSRLSRYSYGVSLSVPFDSSIHLQADKFLDTADGTWRAREQMRWFLKKGDEMIDGEELKMKVAHTVQVGIFSTGHRTFQEHLLICADDVPPSRKTHTVSEFCSVGYSIACDELWKETSYKSPIDKKKRRDAVFELVVKLGGAKIDFQVYYRDSLAAYCEAKYLEDA